MHFYTGAIVCFLCFYVLRFTFSIVVWSVAKMMLCSHVTCVQSCLMYGSETWPIKTEHEMIFNRTDMSMIRRMYGVKLFERKKGEELEELFRL